MKPKYAVPLAVLLALVGLISLQGTIAAPAACDPVTGAGCWENLGIAIVWTGPSDGTSDVWLPEPYLSQVRAGKPAAWVATVPGSTEICVGNMTITFPDGSSTGQVADCVNPLLTPSHVLITITSSTGDSGGFRWSPRDGYGWKAPLVTITKEVINDNGGAAGVSDFQLFLGTILITSGQPKQVNIGLYSLTEQGPTGYSASFSGRCSSLGVMHVVTHTANVCIITNNDVPMSSTIYMPAIMRNWPPVLPPCVDPFTGTCWFDVGGTLYWTDVPTSTADVWLAEPYLGQVRSGKPSSFTKAMSGTLDICVGYVNGVPTTCSGPFAVRPGTFVITGSTGLSGGYRWSKAP